MSEHHEKNAEEKAPENAEKKKVEKKAIKNGAQTNSLAVRMKQWVSAHKKESIAILVVVFLVICAATGAVAMYVSGKDATQPVAQAPAKKKEKKEEPKEIPRRIDGVVVDRDMANTLPACVMIENAAFGGVRPQAGLSEANVVYEVIVEGGITRLMAVYAGDIPEKIGPIRSARDTYLEFVTEYNCPYVHAGGSYTAIINIRQIGIRDVDALLNAKYFYRDGAKVGPHNLFARGPQFHEATSGHDWEDTPPSYESWTYADPKKITTGDVGKTVKIGFGGSYDVEYRYKEDGAVYERFNGGAAHTDANNGNILTAKNIVIQKVGDGISVEGKGRVNWFVTGEGEVVIIRNGIATKGKWVKPNRDTRIQFIDENGKNIPLVPGNTWFEVVPPHIGLTVE